MSKNETDKELADRKGAVDRGDRGWLGWMDAPSPHEWYSVKMRRKMGVADTLNTASTHITSCHLCVIKKGGMYGSNDP